MKSKEDPFPSAVIVTMIGILVLVLVSSSIRSAIRDAMMGFFVLAIIFMLEKVADDGKA